jgi:hypothetical protein
MVVKIKPGTQKSPNGELCTSPQSSSGILSTLKRTLSGKCGMFGIKSEDILSSPSQQQSDISLNRIQSTETVDLTQHMSNDSIISRDASADMCVPRSGPNHDAIDLLPSVDANDRLIHTRDANGVDVWALHRLNESYDSADAVSSSSMSDRSIIGGMLRQSSRDSREDNSLTDLPSLKRYASRESDNSEKVDLFNVDAPCHVSKMRDMEMGNMYNPMISRSESRDYTDISNIASLELLGKGGWHGGDSIELAPVSEEDQFGEL